MQENEHWYSTSTQDEVIKNFELKCRYLFYLKYFEPIFWHDKTLRKILMIFTHKIIPSVINLELYKSIINQKILVADSLWVRNDNYDYPDFIKDFEKLAFDSINDPTILLKTPTKGIEFKWFLTRFSKCGALDMKLPAHSYILIREGVGKIYINELIQLQYAFYSYVKGMYFQSFRDYIVHSMKDQYLHPVNRSIIYNYQNAIVQIHTFLECFINSVRDDWFYRNGFTNEQQVRLMKNIYSTNSKLKKVPRIITKKQNQD